jgi:vitamin-K-epoxide reductase (warfarin-sensitive)
MSTATPDTAMTTATAPSPSRLTAVLGWIIFALAVVGMACSIITLRNHYATSESDYCEVAANFNCDIVNRSIYSTIDKVPVAAIGIAGYALLMGLAPFAKKCRWASLMVLLGAVIGMGFALRLTYIEKYVLFTWCIFCLTSQIVIALILLLSGWQTVRVWRNRPATGD